MPLFFFVNSGTTIVEASSPKAYLKLLTLCDTQDGFVLLRDLVFSLSPQLSGDFHDYRPDIHHSRGAPMALLAHCFLFLL